jgi:RNA polymerase sigma-70 factor (ECF subfamily)
MRETQRAETQSTGQAGVLFEKHHGPIVEYILRRVPHRQDAEDLVQEVFEEFVRAERRNPTEVIRDPLKYIYGIARNVVSDHWKRAVKRPEAIPLDEEALSRVDEGTIDASWYKTFERLRDSRALEQAFESLRLNHRQVLILTKGQGLSYEEAARQLGLTTNTVKKYVHKAMVALRTHWKREL